MIRDRGAPEKKSAKDYLHYPFGAIAIITLWLLPSKLSEE